MKFEEDYEFLTTYDLDTEQSVIEKFKEEVKSGDVVWDIGAHQGIYTITALEQGATVHAFEPSPLPYRTLINNTQMTNSGVCKHYNIAVSNRSASTTLQVEADGGTSSVIPEANKEIEGERTELRVQVYDITQLFDSIGIPDILKIDIEGAEDVLVPHISESMLSDIRSVFCEIHNPDDSPALDHLKNTFKSVKILEERETDRGKQLIVHATNEG